MILARFGIISDKCVVISQRSEAKNLYTAECLQHIETKNYYPHSTCSILGQIFMHRIVFELTPVDWMLFCDFLKLKSSSGRYSQHLEIIICTLHIVAWCLQHFAAKICKLHGPCHLLKPTCTQHFGARPSFPPSLPPSFPSSCGDYLLLSSVGFLL